MPTRFYESPNDVNLKPMKLAGDDGGVRQSTYSIDSTLSDASTYFPLPPQDSQTAKLQAKDAKLKRAIRIMKLVSRASATVVSAVTLVPMLMTLVKFLRTKDVYFDVDGKRRTAWANDTIAWYTYMYTSIAAVSFVLNLGVMAGYCRSVGHANRVATIGTWWTWTIMLGHVVTWAVAAGLYRYGKEPVNGKFRDLWGWTCSSAADELQSVLTSVDFGKYCSVQTSGFYAGIVNVVLGLLSAVTMGFGYWRMRSKKKVMQASSRDSDIEPLRW